MFLSDLSPDYSRRLRFLVYVGKLIVYNLEYFKDQKRWFFLVRGSGNLCFIAGSV